MSCPGPCTCHVESTSCIEVLGNGRRNNPLRWAPILDPSGIAVCGAAGLYVPGGEVGQAFAISPVYSPGSPPPVGPADIATVAATVTNPTDVDLIGFFVFSLQANKNIHGSMSVDAIIYASFDAGPEVQVTQDLHALTGAIGSNPAVGGDGSVLVGGRNGIHNDHTSATTRISGGADGTIPATITPGAHTLNMRVEMISSGLWDDPANPGDSFAFWLAVVGWVLVPPG